MYYDYARQQDGTVAFRTNVETVYGSGALTVERVATHPAVELAAPTRIAP